MKQSISTTGRKVLLKSINARSWQDLIKKTMPNFSHQGYICASKGKHAGDCSLAWRPSNMAQNLSKPQDPPTFSKESSLNYHLGMVPGLC